jgi:hypothetical protein
MNDPSSESKPNARPRVRQRMRNTAIMFVGCTIGAALTRIEILFRMADWTPYTWIQPLIVGCIGAAVYWHLSSD